MKKLLVTTFTALLVTAVAHAASFTWQSADNGVWTTPADWTLNSGTDADGIPDADDDVIIGSATGVAKSMTVDSAVSANTVTMNNANLNTFISINDGGSLTVTSGQIVKGATGNAGIRIQQTSAASASSILTADVQASKYDVWINGGTAYWATVTDQDLVANSTSFTVGNANTGNLGRSGDFTLVAGSTLATNRGVVLENNGASGSSTFNLNGGTLRLRGFNSTGIERLGDGQGSAVFSFNSGTISNDAAPAGLGANQSEAFIRSNTTTATVLDITLGASGTRTIETANATTLNQESTARFVNQTGVKGGFTKTGAGTLSLAGDNTYTGDTVVSQGTLALTSAGELAFDVEANGVNTEIYDNAGNDAILTLDGTFRLTLGGADTTAGNLWTLVDVPTFASVTYGTNFNVTSDLGAFTETANIWTLDEGGRTWTYTEASGVLTVVPEPSAAGLLLLGSLLLGVGRRRR